MTRGGSGKRLCEVPGPPHFTKEHDETFREALYRRSRWRDKLYRANIPLLQDPGSGCWPSPTASTPVPALLIWGETDTTFVAEFIDEFDQYATNLEVKRLPDIGHTPMLEAPSLTTSIIRNFCSLGSLVISRRWQPINPWQVGNGGRPGPPQVGLEVSV